MNIGQGPKVPTTNLVDDLRSSDKFGELFKLLNSPYCETFFYANLTSDNKLLIIDNMTNDAIFMDTAKTFVSDENVIRSKVETKLEQILTPLTIYTGEDLNPHPFGVLHTNL